MSADQTPPQDPAEALLLRLRPSVPQLVSADPLPRLHGREHGDPDTWLDARGAATEAAMTLDVMSQLRAYREAMGDEAADRQAKLADALRSCCATAWDQPHAEACPVERKRRMTARRG